MSEAIEHMDAFTLLTDSVFYLIKTSDKPELRDVSNNVVMHDSLYIIIVTGTA